jgi:putative transposase
LYPYLSIDTICKLFGYTRQAWYKGNRNEESSAVKAADILSDVQAIRSDQSKIGTIKLLKKIREKQARKVIGRDAFFNLLRNQKLLIKPRKVYKPQLTNGDGISIYPDYRKGLQLERINQLWACDITYFRLTEANIFCYLTLVVDEHSHLIVGHHVSLDQTAEEILKALEYGVRDYAPSNGVFEPPVFFHTDRGGQFKSGLFKTFCKDHGLVSSMCRAGKSSENPVSERLNGILKTELICGDEFRNFEEAVFLIAKAIKIYNEDRPHLSCGLLTPLEAHKPDIGVLKKLWRQRKPRSRN